MQIQDFDYHLPEALIAQRPADRRENARLLVLHRDSGRIEHRHFYDILEYLQPGDCLVLNNSKVLPARLFGEKEATGGKVEFLLLKGKGGDVWQTMVKPGKRLKTGDVVRFGEDFKAKILGDGSDGTRLVEFQYDGIFMERLEAIGSVPLPPYIRRSSDKADQERYQTVYCREEGSVAAPTAGLHFTKDLLQRAEEKGIHIAQVTLHVGIGTFRPVQCQNIQDHVMHEETYEITRENAEKINATRRAGGRVVSVGTTSARTLESAAVYAENHYEIQEKTDSTDIFIYPGYRFKMVDALLTNFHLPKSTLLMLLSAFYDREAILNAYQEAIKENYRFFSYGDAMLLV